MSDLYHFCLLSPFFLESASFSAYTNCFGGARNALGKWKTVKQQKLCQEEAALSLNNCLTKGDKFSQL